MHNRKEIGTVHQTTFTSRGEDERAVILLAGQSWLVTDLDWDRRIAYAEPFDMQGKSTWLSAGNAMSRRLAEAHRAVLCGSDRARSHWSERAAKKLEFLREDQEFLADDRPTVVRGIDDWDVYTFAGGQANAYLADRLEAEGVGRATSTGLRVRIQENVEVEELRRALHEVDLAKKIPEIPPDHPMLRDLKFAEVLPGDLLQRAGRARIYGDGPDELPPLQNLEWVGE